MSGERAPPCFTRSYVAKIQVEIRTCIDLSFALCQRLSLNKGPLFHLHIYFFGNKSGHFRLTQFLCALNEKGSRRDVWEFPLHLGRKEADVIDTRILRFISLSGLHSDFRQQRIFMEQRKMPPFCSTSRCCDFKVKELWFKWRCLTTNMYKYTIYPKIIFTIGYEMVWALFFSYWSCDAPNYHNCVLWLTNLHSDWLCLVLLINYYANSSVVTCNCNNLKRCNFISKKKYWNRFITVRYTYTIRIAYTITYECTHF